MSKRRRLGRRFADLDEVYVIGEAGNNHNGELARARALIDAAVNSGCHAVKFQKRDIGQMFTDDILDAPFQVDGAPDWGSTQRTVREHLELSADEFAALRDYARDLEIDFIATPFDCPSAQVLAGLEMDAWKISSHSFTDLPLLEAVAAHCRLRPVPVFLSVSMADEDDVRSALGALAGLDVVLMHCVSSYPMRAEDARLGYLEWLRAFGYPVGFSDHETGTLVASAAVALGARVIEKHFTLDRTLPGFDHTLSLEPEGLRGLVRDIGKIKAALSGGDVRTGVLPCERRTFNDRRKSLVSTQLIPCGTPITPDMLTTKGPNRGLEPKLIRKVVGTRPVADIPAGTHITAAALEA